MEEVTSEQRFGPYTLLRKLGDAPGSQVWIARNPGGKEVSLKFVNVDDDFVLPSEVAEFFYAGAAAHPNLVSVERVGRSGLWGWLASTKVEGKTWREIIDACQAARTSLPPECVADMAAGVCAALVKVHAVELRNGKLWHRAISTSNLLLDAEGTARVIDFDLAHEARERDPRREDARAAYDAPELRDAGGGPAADMFALGVSLYELLVGSSPYFPNAGPDDLEKKKADRIHTLVRLGDQRDIVGPFHDLIGRLLSPAADARPSAAEAFDILQNIELSRHEGLDTAEAYRILFGSASFPVDGETASSWRSFHRAAAAIKGRAVKRIATMEDNTEFYQEAPTLMHDGSEFAEAPTQVFIRPSKEDGQPDSMASLEEEFERFQAQTGAVAAPAVPAGGTRPFDELISSEDEHRADQPAAPPPPPPFAAPVDDGPELGPLDGPQIDDSEFQGRPALPPPPPVDNDSITISRTTLLLGAAVTLAMFVLGIAAAMFING